MLVRFFSGASRGWMVLSALGTWGFAAACESSGHENSSPAAAGMGGSAGTGVVDAVPLAGKAGGESGGAGGAPTVDPCQEVPAGKLALIDDFDDGDTVAAYEPDREAYWFTITDGTAGTLEPSGDFSPVAGGYDGTKSAHVSASGFTDWGASLVANISNKTSIRCPFNASGFAGLRFVARGSGRVRVQLAMPEVVDKEFGGKCDEKAGQRCYDHHGIFIPLTREFRIYELPWSSLMQRGFGEAVTFDPKTILSLYFSMERAELPVDLWVDQVELWDGEPSNDGAGGAENAGAGGAGDEGGSAGQGGGGGDGIPGTGGSE